MIMLQCKLYSKERNKRQLTPVYIYIKPSSTFHLAHKYPTDWHRAILDCLVWWCKRSQPKASQLWLKTVSPLHYRTLSNDIGSHIAMLHRIKTPLNICLRGVGLVVIEEFIRVVSEVKM